MQLPLGGLLFNLGRRLRPRSHDIYLRIYIYIYKSHLIDEAQGLCLLLEDTQGDVGGAESEKRNSSAERNSSPCQLCKREQVESKIPFQINSTRGKSNWLSINSNCLT